VIHNVYYICTFGLVEGESESAIPTQREQYGGTVHLFIGFVRNPIKSIVMTLTYTHHPNTNIRN
jgi:molybdopterin synthase catalytic subunit